MGIADEIGCGQSSSGSEATQGPSEGKTSAEASVDDPCRSNDKIVPDPVDDSIDEKEFPLSPVVAGDIGSESAFRDDEDSHDYLAGDTNNDGALPEQTLHGHPITVSQCKFQAHVGRISNVAEARKVSNDVLMATKREAAYSECVAPFAYRLACVREGVRQPPRNIGEGRHGLDEDCDDQEGYCDNGDVGSGEKLLHLLQKWDIRHRVLMVTRIDGGFMKAELMGIRRYKFVIDRAKRLLDSTDLASLRRAVATDIHQPTTADSNANLNAHVAAASGRYRAGTDAPLEDRWDQFVVPLAARRRISVHAAHDDLLGAPRASGGGAILPPRKYGGEGRGGLRARQEKAVGDSSGTRERRALSLAQLSISSKTIPFPRGHVPSVMGDKGYGKKRGRINHFAVRTPPPSSSGDDNSHNDHNHDQGGSVSCFFQAGEEATPGSSDDAQGVHGKVSGWSLPHELDPTSKVTDPEKHRQGSTGNRGWTNCSVNTAGVSRASTCDTINSPSRVAAIMLGVIPRISGDHPLHPPPPAATVATTGRYHPREIRRSLPPPFTNSSDGSDSLSSAGLCRGVLSRVDTASSSDGMQHCRGFLPGEGAAWSGRGRLPHRPTGGGRGGGGCTATTGAAGYDRRNPNDTIEQVYPSTGIGGVGDTTTTDSAGGSHGLPLLHRAPGMSVHDGTPPSLYVPTRDGGGGDGSASAAGEAPPLLSNESMMDRWKSDDDRSSSVGIAADCGVRAGAEDDEDTSAGEPVQNRAGPAIAPRGRLLGGTIFVPNSDVRNREDRERQRVRETSTTWVADDLTDLRGMASGRSDPPPTRSKSAIRGWSVGLVVPACSPLATEKRPAACKKR